LVWVAESGQDLVLLLLDLKKTFDRIEWGFLFPALSKTRFLSHLDSMDLLSLLAYILINKSKWGTRRELQTRQVSQARLFANSIPIYP
jgi:hypothetical protein